METAAPIQSENRRKHGAEPRIHSAQKSIKKCKLTDRYVANIAPPARGQETHYDTLIECFGVHVGYGGAKTWIVQHRVEMFDHKTGTHKRVARRLKLGRYPVMTLEAARKGAREALMLIAEGKDPKHEQDLEQEARRVEQRDSFGHIRERFLAEYEGRRRPLKSKTRRDYTRILRTLFPDWEHKPFRDITRRDVKEAIGRIVRSRGGCPANRAFACLRKMMNWALNEVIIESAPTIGLQRPAIEEARERTLHERELFWLWQGFKATPVFEPVLKLLLITAQRREEVAGMQTGELSNVDGAEPLWTISPERAKNGNEHLVPLSNSAVSIVKAPRASGRLLFTTTGKSPVSGYSKSKLCIEKYLKARQSERHSDLSTAALASLLADNWRIHDFRRTAATKMAEFGVPRDVVELILNHVSGSRGGVAGIYNRSELLTERRVALDLWANYLQRVTAECMSDAGIEALRTQMRTEYRRRLSVDVCAEKKAQSYRPM